jgi:hypothetical protein
MLGTTSYIIKEVGPWGFDQNRAIRPLRKGLVGRINDHPKMDNEMRRMACPIRLGDACASQQPAIAAQGPALRGRRREPALLLLRTIICPPPSRNKQHRIKKN